MLTVGRLEWWARTLRDLLRTTLQEAKVIIQAAEAILRETKERVL